MISTTYLHKEFHENGTLKYRCTRSEIKKGYEHLYPNRISNTVSFIKVGNCSRFFDNGQLNWQMNYDNRGNLITEKLPFYRKDGTIIQF